MASWTASSAKLQMLEAEQPSQAGDGSSCLPAKQVFQQYRAAQLIHRIIHEGDHPLR
jgi:hypothetical protein